MVSSSSSTPRLATALSNREPAAASLQCCCGRPDCLVLKKNSTVLESVEKDVHTAAQLGQVRCRASTAFQPTKSHPAQTTRAALDMLRDKQPKKNFIGVLAVFGFVLHDLTLLPVSLSFVFLPFAHTALPFFI